MAQIFNVELIEPGVCETKLNDLDSKWKECLSKETAPSCIEPCYLLQPNNMPCVLNITQTDILNYS